MGVAGVAFIYGAIFFVKSIISLVQFLVWSRKDVVSGRIDEVLRSETIGKTMKHTYSFLLDTPTGRVNSEYVESIRAKDVSKIRKGQMIEVYYDQETKTYKEKEKLKKALWQNPLNFLLAVVILIACFWIVALLNRR